MFTEADSLRLVRNVRLGLGRQQRTLRSGRFGQCGGLCFL